MTSESTDIVIRPFHTVAHRTCSAAVRARSSSTGRVAAASSAVATAVTSGLSRLAASSAAATAATLSRRAASSAVATAVTSGLSRRAASSAVATAAALSRRAASSTAATAAALSRRAASSAATRSCRTASSAAAAAALSWPSISPKVCRAGTKVYGHRRSSCHRNCTVSTAAKAASFSSPTTDNPFFRLPSNAPHLSSNH